MLQVRPCPFYTSAPCPNYKFAHAHATSPPIPVISTPKNHSSNPGIRGKFANLQLIVNVRLIVTASIPCFVIIPIDCQAPVSMHSRQLKWGVPRTEVRVHSPDGFL